jgi:hypothetical protein
LTFVAEIDPDKVIPESDKTDNRFPATGMRPVNVRAAPTVGVRLVPVAQSVAGGRTGLVSKANVDQFMDLSRRIHPIGTYDVDVRETYTTSRPILQAQDQNNSWSLILEEINSLRIADKSERYYYGVVGVTYSSTGGVAGVAYVPGKAGIGWDAFPSATQIIAHELGHSFGRFHTPCGSPSQIDPSYPTTGLYSGGRIGAYGYDALDMVVKEADAYSDVMGYCSARWISDYTYVGMLDRLSVTGPSLPGIAANAPEQPSLLVWGRIVDGVPVLEPAFEVSARPSLPQGAGPHRISAVDENGAELFAYSFAGERIADAAGDAETFAFAVPLSALRGHTLGALRLNARGRTVTSVASIDVAADPNVQLSRANAGAVRMRWDAARFPVVMVRNPLSGQVLSFARGGDATIVTGSDELELNYSNRVRSARRLVPVR